MKHSKKGTSACHWSSNLSCEHICALPNLVKNKIDRVKERKKRYIICMYICMKNN